MTKRKPPDEFRSRLSDSPYPNDWRGRAIILLHLYSLPDGLHDEDGLTTRALQHLVCGETAFGGNVVPSLQSCLKTLIVKGLVQSDRNPSRTKALVITHKGRQLVDRLPSKVLADLELLVGSPDYGFRPFKRPHAVEVQQTREGEALAALSTAAAALRQAAALVEHAMTELRAGVTERAAADALARRLTGPMLASVSAIACITDAARTAPRPTNGSVPHAAFLAPVGS